MNLIKATIPNIGSGNDPAINALDAPYAVAAVTASGAISATQGLIAVTAGSVAALTLAAPVAGLPSPGGNDGQTLEILSTTAYAHTVTTPSNAINGSKHIATFAAAVGNFLILEAYNGVWYALAQTGITLS